jgi:hypothetical protein
MKVNALVRFIAVFASLPYCYPPKSDKTLKICPRFKHVCIRNALFAVLFMFACGLFLVFNGDFVINLNHSLFIH